MTSTTYTSTTYTQAAYQAADQATKAHMRATVAADMVAAIGAGDLATAQQLVAIQAELKAARPEKTGPDYAAAIRDLRASLLAAVSAIELGEAILPEGVDFDQSTVDFDESAHVDVKLVTRLITVAGRKAGRGSVDDYVFEALTRLDGPATITQLSAAWVASEDYPKSAPSTGAIGAAIKRGSDERWAACEVDGKAGAELV